MGISRDSRHKRRQTGGKRPQNIKKRNYEMGRPSAMTKMGAKRIHIVRTRGGNKKFRALRLETGNFAWSSESATRKTRVVDVVYNATSNELIRTKTLVKGAIIQIDATPFRQWFEAHYGVPLGRKKPVKDAAAGKKDAGKKDAGKKDAGKKDAGKKDAGKKDAGKNAGKKDAGKKDAAATGKKDAGKKDAGKKDAAATGKKDAGKKDGKVTRTSSGKVTKTKEKAKEEDPLTKKKSKHVKRKLAKRAPASKIDTQLIDQFATGRLYARISSRPGQSGRCDGYILEGQELAFYLRKLKAKKEGK